MTIAVLHAESFIHNVEARMPFRYGIAQMTAVPHVFLRLVAEVDGQEQNGIAADSLIPKWFTKDPATRYADDIQDMLAVIDHAAQLAAEIGVQATPFDLWLQLYRAQATWAAEQGYPPLLWNFAVSLVERAMLDAFCRARGESIERAMRSNSLGIRLGAIHPTLNGFQPDDLLPRKMKGHIAARHTVGLGDPLAQADIPPAERLDDGLPQALDECIRSYGLTHFKLKLCGDLESDLQRLKRIAAVLQENAPRDFAFTLDGNEQYHSLEEFQAFWQALEGDADLEPFRRRLLFVEQPLHRRAALRPDTLAALHAWEQRPPLIIDESDAELSSLPTALAGGYCGSSHKNCKGIFKGIANAGLLAYTARQDPGSGTILSGEDLINIGPVALQQDLALMALLGIPHVERNGHHYFKGLSMFPEQIQELVLNNHPDLYARHPRGYVSLRLEQGILSVDSIRAAPFGVTFTLEVNDFTPSAQWSFDTLKIPEQSPEKMKER